jgi:acetylornithine deacetylase/succinyl-diaminopimelate desuccinylase-like protein
MPDALLDDLIDWLRIPSISTGGGLPADLHRAAEWACERVDAAGGDASLLMTRGNPIAYGELKAADPEAPTVLIYGHYDVQSVGDADAWTSHPFEPDIRDGRIYARGASDDKGNFLPLMHVACALAREGELPVNVRVLVEGEEEAGGEAVAEWVREDEQGADCAIVFDSDMVNERLPAITVGLRGIVMTTVTVRVGRRDLHSGMYGGSVVNAIHVLQGMLGAVQPGANGVLRDELRVGIEPPAAAEIESWAALPPGGDVLAEVGGMPLSDTAGDTYYARNGADASLDINEFVAGEPRTIVPATARATVSIRLAPGQDAATVSAALQSLLRAAAPAGVEVAFEAHLAEPALFGVDSRPMQLAADGMEKACGVRPAFVRSGGSIPVVAEFAAKGITTIVSGFALADDDIHAPNESYRLESLRMGEVAARELYVSLAGLRK